MDRWLKRDRGVDTGPVFEWLTDTDGKWHSAEVFPLPEREPLRASGSGSLAISPGAYPTGGGQADRRLPRPRARSSSTCRPPTGTLDVLGEPRLELTYRGTAAPAQTHLYAQLVDVRVDRVAGNQVAPVPVTLDGQEHKLELPIEPIAVRAREGPAPEAPDRRRHDRVLPAAQQRHGRSS